MKLYLASDIHLEFYKDPKDYPLLTSEKKDGILILAGDIVTNSCANKTVDWWSYHSKMFDHILYVPGNHDYYGGKFRTLPKLKKIILGIDNITHLQNNSILLDGINFFGSTLWTDLNDGDWFTCERIKRGFSDFTQIEGMTINGWQTENSYARECLELFLVNHNQAFPSVIITHHLPDMSCVHPKWIGNSLNPGFANTGLTHLIEEYKPNLWVYGHTHDPMDKMIYETRVVCNPMGYIRYEQNKVDNWKLLRIDI